MFLVSTGPSQPALTSSRATSAILLVQGRSALVGKGTAVDSALNRVNAEAQSAES